MKKNLVFSAMLAMGLLALFSVTRIAPAVAESRASPVVNVGPGTPAVVLGVPNVAADPAVVLDAMAELEADGNDVSKMVANGLARYTRPCNGDQDTVVLPVIAMNQVAQRFGFTNPADLPPDRAALRQDILKSFRDAPFCNPAH